MVNKEKKTLDEVLNSLDAKQKETTQNLRSLIKTNVPETTEIIRHGKITYSLDGKDFVSVSYTHLTLPTNREV